MKTNIHTYIMLFHKIRQKVLRGSGRYLENLSYNYYIRILQINFLFLWFLLTKDKPTLMAGKASLGWLGGGSPWRRGVRQAPPWWRRGCPPSRSGPGGTTWAAPPASTRTAQTGRGGASPEGGAATRPCGGGGQTNVNELNWADWSINHINLPKQTCDSDMTEGFGRWTIPPPQPCDLKFC